MIVICPHDATAAAAAAAAARDADVKVISYDRLIRDTEAVDYYVRHIGSEAGPVTPIAAARGWGLDRLRRLIAEVLSEEMVDITVTIPYSAAELVNLFHRYGLIEREEQTENGARISGKIPERLEPEFREHKNY